MSAAGFAASLRSRVVLKLLRHGKLSEERSGGWFLFWFLMGFEMCSSLNREGVALLRFKEMIEADPSHALLDWDEGNASPCSWFGVECSDDGLVTGLACYLRRLENLLICILWGYGTLEELLELIAWAQLGIHDKPVGLLNVDGHNKPLLSFIDKAVEEGFINPTAQRPRN